MGSLLAAEVDDAALVAEVLLSGELAAEPAVGESAALDCGMALADAPALDAIGELIGELIAGMADDMAEVVAAEVEEELDTAGVELLQADTPRMPATTRADAEMRVLFTDGTVAAGPVSRRRTTESGPDAPGDPVSFTHRSEPRPPRPDRGLTACCLAQIGSVLAMLAGSDGNTRFIVHRVQDVTAARTLRSAIVTATSAIVKSRNLDAANDFTLVARDLRRSADLPEDLTEQFENLLTLLDTRALIDQAKGMLMAAGRVNADQAFDLLRRRSQTDDVKLRDVAARHVALHSAATVAGPT